MIDIKWKEGVAFFVGGQQWREHVCGDLSYIGSDDFQLNEIQQGDYIGASELNTEQKCNDAVAVFGLFGFARDASHGESEDLSYYQFLKVNGYRVIATDNKGDRKLTYNQLMAIGKLKRAMIEREKFEGRQSTEKMIKPSDAERYCTPQATPDCKELNLNLVITGDGRYILDCESSKEYTVNSDEDYKGVVGAIRLLQEREKHRGV